MNGEETGGVAGLRAWAADAAERAKRLLPAVRGGAVPSGAYDASVAELEELAGLLDHDPGLRSTVRVWLGGALAARSLAGSGGPRDRERAEALLRAARDRATEQGAAAGEEDRRWAAFFLLPLVSPLQMQPGASGGAPDLSAYAAWAARTGPAGMVQTAAELQTLTEEVLELPLPEDFLAQLRQMHRATTAPSGPSLSDLLATMTPAGSPFAEQMRQTMENAFNAPGGSAGSSTASAAPPGPPDREPAGPGPGQDRGPDPAPGPDPASEPDAASGSEVAPEPDAVPEQGRSPEAEPGSRPDPGAAPGHSGASPGTGSPLSAERTDAAGAATEPGPPPPAGPPPGPSPDSVPPPSGPPPPPGPGLTPDDIRRLTATMDAVHATTWGLEDVLKGSDPEALDALLRRLRAVQDQPPPGPDPADALESLRALLLNISPGVGGTHEDTSAGRAHLATVVDHLSSLAGALPAGVGDPAVWGRAFALYTRVMAAGETEDVHTLRELVAEAEALEESVPEDEPFRFAVLWALGAAVARLGIVTGDRTTVLRALPHIEAGHAGMSALPFADELPLPLPPLPDLDLLRAGLGGGPAPVHEHVPAPPDAAPEELHTAALDLALRFSLTRDPALLDALIGQLERVRDRVREGRAPRIAADALWELAQAYRERGVLKDDVTDIAALEAAKEALTALAADVLLQAGAEHGLLAARSGANRGVQAALWAASQGRLHEAVAVLELGRALVLHAASTSSAVPELLEAAGHHALAEQWRVARGAAGNAEENDGCGEGTEADEGGVPGRMPSTLRRQALEALGYRDEDGLLGTPSLSALSDGIADSGADALLYLVPGEGENPGVVLVVAPRLGAAVGVAPLLSGAGSGPLENYLDATAARDAAAGSGRSADPSAEQTWDEALAALCDWAHQVLGPVLGGVRAGLAEERPAEEREAEERPVAEGPRRDGLLRIVLVPCGRLGIVPWHAASREGAAGREHLCRTTVVSYAASGGEFLRSVRRAPRDPAAAPVLLADPGMDLAHAEVEVMALRDAFYREARMCGGIFELPEEELLPGTPEDVLALLADGASLLHVASHGSAGTRPTVSALHLAAPEGTGAPAADGAAPGNGPDPGMLTVTRLLDRPSARGGADRAYATRAGAGDGAPLVVLSACQTDLSTRDHDEALTLTTAFVSGGARDVVGSRWRTDDAVSALLMAVFHHYVTVDGLGPADALRAAQLWMLDPDRKNPGSLRGPLLRQMERPDLDRARFWAAFIHQGHPGPGRTVPDAGRGAGRGGGGDE
ncbi:CHAT domain-containing protein [Streptomyces qinglanensis]|uniref:CHAT domain-containing protein n=2 Tax=Streptomyces qinglanensis TaxID=943816 RepID=A0A1H9RV18_9ACTN|nr:CHAT domain-containing protein [Streptomyces qinglanensis]SER75769.1 CHAT domain-containing protein [Streptomyces qinglanensis]